MKIILGIANVNAGATLFTFNPLKQPETAQQLSGSRGYREAGRDGQFAAVAG